MNYLQIQIEKGDPPLQPTVDGTKIRKTVIKDFILKVLDYLGKDKWELSVLFCNDSFIQELNSVYRGKDEPTDVLTFAQVDSDIPFPAKNNRYYAGDIAISLETLSKNSKAFDVSPDEELKRLLIHGILHLDGMDHEDNEPEREMLVLQEKILQDFKGVQLL